MSKIIAVSALTAAVAAVGISAISLASAVNTRAELVSRTAVPAPTPVKAGFQFQSEEQFQEAVITALNRMVKERQEQELNSKLEAYTLAPEIAPDGKKIYGNINARFTLVEYSETECPFCVKHHPVMKALVDQSEGNINWQWKHLPLGFHNPAAIQQAIVGECVAEQQGNRAFWVYIDEVFKKSAGNGKGVADLSQLVEDMAVDMGELRKCLGSNRMRDVVEADIKAAEQAGISGTPATYVLDNQTGKAHLISGAQPVGVFNATINRMIEETQGNATAVTPDVGAE